MRLPVLMVIVCYIVLLLTDWLILSDLRHFSSRGDGSSEGRKPGYSVWFKVFGVFAFLVLALLTVAVSLPRRSVSMGVTPTMWMLYIVLTVEFAQIVYCLFSLLGFIPRIFGKPRLRLGLWIGLPLGILVFCMMWWGTFVGRYRIETVRVDVSSPRLPESFEGYRIAQISDLHVGTWGQDTAFVSRLVDEVNALHPDLIVFTGDLVNRDASEAEPFIEPLSRLSAPDGVLTILGNHDYGDYVSWDSPTEKALNLDNLKSYERMMGWRLLDNAHCFIAREKGDSIAVIGVGNWGEPPFSQYGNLADAYPEELHNDSRFKLLLSHNPEHWNREVSHLTNIDLTLAGHTHAMQILFSLGAWRWSPAVFKYDQWGGLYSRKGATGEPVNINVNIGAGEVGLPMRIGADPEITLITLHRSK